MAEQDSEDVVDLLSSDHREVMGLLGQISSTSDAEAKREMADTVITELVRHSVAEEMFVYPAMKEYLEDGEQAVQHDTEEHQQIEETLKELEGADPSEGRFSELLQRLQGLLEDHVDDEESEQFPKLRERVPREELVEMAGKVRAAKAVAPTRPHPSAPNDQLFHKLVGPGVGLVDRVRDKLSSR